MKRNTLLLTLILMGFSMAKAEATDIGSDKPAVRQGSSPTSLVDSAPSDVTLLSITPTTATLKWKGSSDSYRVRYKREADGNGASFFDNFESGSLTDKGWTIRTEGEAPFGDGWECINQAFKSAHSGEYLAAAWSWRPNVAYAADNWLITPLVYLTGKLCYWETCDQFYPDSYEVLLSTIDEDIANFTTTLRPLAPASKTWTEVCIDLSEYQGQAGYIAIHHLCTDCDGLLIDDFGIYPKYEDWASVETDEKNITLAELKPNSTYDYEVIGVVQDEEGASSGIASFTTLPANPMPTDVAIYPAGTSVTVSWTGYGDSYDVYFRKSAVYGSFSDSFESGLSQWTVRTEGESPTPEGWVTEDGSLSGTAYDGSFYACSKSWTPGSGSGQSYDADNWLITPLLNLDSGTFSFWEKAPDPNYRDQFEVLLSTTGNAVADFTTVLRPLQPASEDWNKVTLATECSSESGVVPGYIAIRHKEKDKFHLHIDDVQFSGKESVESGEWKSINTSGTEFTISNLEPDTRYELYIISVGDLPEEVSGTGLFCFATQPSDPVDIVLDADGNNNSIIGENDDALANATIDNLTLRKDGVWQGICLPFDVDVENSILKGADVRKLDVNSGLTIVDNVALVDFLTPVTNIEAGLPYILRWESGVDIVNPVFRNVKINRSRNGMGNPASVLFAATYEAIRYDYDSPQWFHLTETPELSPFEAGYVCHAFEGFFRIGIESYPDIIYYVLNTGEEDDLVTGITATDNDRQPTEIYNLSGQRLSKMQRGINIVRQGSAKEGGKKILVR